jgi:hypothetical protein
MEHQVRVPDLVVAPDEAATLEVVRRPGTAAQEQPLEADPWLAPVGERGLHRNRFRAAVLDVDLEMVLKVLADARHVDEGRDADSGEFRRVADAAQLEDLG